MNRCTRALAAALSLVLLLSACTVGENVNDVQADDIATADYNAQPRENLQDGGTLTTAIAEVPEQQNTFHANASGSTATLWQWYNPQMLLTSPEGEISPNPSYITSMDADDSSGVTVVTYKLHPKATFNDGTPIDYRAFVATWVINRGDDENFTPSATDGYEQITDVSAGTNDKEVRVTFNSVYPWWRNVFSDIAHPALEDPENYNDYINTLHPEWGAGPFTVDQADFHRGEVSFRRNDKWWGETPKLERRVFRQMEAQAAINAFKNGEIDATSVADRDRYASVALMSDIEIYTGRDTRNTLLLLNGNSELLADVRVRKAVAMALDRETLNRLWFQGLPYAEDPPGSFTFYPFQKQYHDNFSEVAHFDTATAEQLLDEAGWQRDGDYRSKDGKRLSLRYVLVGESEQVTSNARAIQQMMRDVGIDLQISTQPSSEFANIWASRDFDIFPMAFSSGSADGAAYFGQMYLSDSELNASGTGTAEIDAEIRAMQQLPTAQEQDERANSIEVTALARFGIIPLTNGASITATKQGLANFGPMGFGTVPIEDVGWEE